MGLIGAAFAAMAVCLLLAAVAHDRVAYAPLRRAVRDGRLDARVGGSLRSWRGSGMAEHPEAEYRYVAYEVPPGTRAIVRGRLDPRGRYYAIAVYDRWMQSLSSPGPTFQSASALEVGPDGAFTLVLAHEDPGVPWLDVSAAPRGVLFERHLGGAPRAVSTLDPAL